MAHSARIDFLKGHYLPKIEANIAVIRPSWHDTPWPFGEEWTDDYAASFIFNRMVETDPDTIRHKNADVLLRWCAEGKINALERPKITQDIELFQRIKAKPDFKHSRDLREYESPEALAAVLEPYRTIFMRSPYMIDCDKRFLVGAGKRGAILLYQDADCRLLRLSGIRATKAYCKHMRTCLKTNVGSQEFKRSYSQDLLLLQASSGKRWLISFNRMQWRDENDIGENVDLGSIIENNAGLCDALRPYFYFALEGIDDASSAEARALFDMYLRIPSWQEKGRKLAADIILYQDVHLGLDVLDFCVGKPNFAPFIKSQHIIRLLTYASTLNDGSMERLVGTVMGSGLDTLQVALRKWQSGLAKVTRRTGVKSRPSG